MPRRALPALAGLLLSISSACAADKVSVGILNAAGDIGMFIAEARGYFKSENLDVTLTPLDSAVKMMPSLSTGDLDVGSGVASAALYNAATRKIDVRVVASRGRTAPGYVYQSLIIRKDHVDSGRFKTLADLKGLKFGFVSPGSSLHSLLNEAAKAGGVSIKDIPVVYTNVASQVAALQSGAIDASIMVEPYAGQAVALGGAVNVMPSETFYPSDEASLLLYGDRFIKERPAVAVRLMKGWMRGVRGFNNVLKDGRWAKTPQADEVIGIFAKAVNFPESLVRNMTPQYADPNGEVNLDSLRKDLAFFKSTGEVESQTIQADDIIDLSFARKAAQELGPYKAP